MKQRQPATKGLFCPRFSLETVKRLVSEGKFFLADGATASLKPKYDGDILGAAKEIVDCIEGKNFQKSSELIKRPGKIADIYDRVPYDKELWYVKLFIEDGDLQVNIWSMKPDKPRKGGKK